MSENKEPFPDQTIETSEVNRRSLWVTAVAAAAREVSGMVAKAGRNSHQSYNYCGHEHVIQHVRDVMLQHGLVIGAPVTTAGPHPHLVPVRGDTKPVWGWSFAIPVYHDVSGHCETFNVSATTQANDKAAFVASTAADRTLRLRLMGLAGGAAEDPEHDSQGKPSGDFGGF